MEITMSISDAERKFHAPRLDNVHRITIIGSPTVSIGIKRREAIKNAAWQRVLVGDYGIRFRAAGCQWDVSY